MAFLNAQPYGEDGVLYPLAASGQIENHALSRPENGGDGGDMVTRESGVSDFDEKPTDTEFLQMVRDAESQAQMYIAQVNRKAWARTYRAFHQEHFTGSKYRSAEYDNRSKLFIPKTRTALRKDLAAVAASMFGTLDAVACLPGDESSAEQRAAAAVIQELVNYRTDRASGRASIPWFHIVLGARQTSQLTGICLSKQSWKLELKRDGVEDYEDEDEYTGETRRMQRDVWVPDIDRPDSQLIPPENFDIDPAADWVNPAQSAAFIIIRWPMRIDEIRRKQRDPRMPWNDLTEAQLRGASAPAKMDMEAIRRAREQGLDRFDESQTGNTFEVIWVYENFIRTGGEDWTFLSVGHKHMLTDPRPVREVYPEQHGERPLVFGFGAFEAFRIFPMANAESWQMLQQEANDLRNLSLDAIKQNVMPVAKVVRGRQIDLEQLRRRGQGSAIMVNNKDDVTWEKVPDISGGIQTMKQSLDIEFDDLAGQQNYGTVADNNVLGKTLGGLKLAAGAANAVQEFDIRVWIETWAEPVLTQIVRLIQFYESDPIVLGLCGQKAKLFQKFGISEITDQLLENDVTIRVNVGLGAGDPQQRLAKFQSATAIVAPLLAQSKDFQTGKKEMDWEAVMAEVYGAAGYRDGGKRFVKDGAPQGPNPQRDATVAKLQSETERNKAQAKKSIIDALVNAAKIGLDTKRLQAEVENMQFDNHMRHLDQMGNAMDKGLDHAEKLRGIKNAARGLNPDGTPVQPGGMEGGAGGPPNGPTPAQSASDDGQGGGGGPALDALSMDGVPPPDVGHQEEAQPQPRRRSITGIKRDKNGRIVGLDVVDH